MKHMDVRVGAVYRVSAGGRWVPVRVTRITRRHYVDSADRMRTKWIVEAVNLITGRRIRRSTQALYPLEPGELEKWQHLIKKEYREG